MVAQRSGRRRTVAAATGVLCAGFVLSASAVEVDARPIVVLDQIDDRAGAAASPVEDAGLGSNASVSGDGRFVAYQGLPAPGDPAVAGSDTRTSTIYLTDRESGVTSEVTPVPDGMRPGNSINAVLSGDGCSIVVVTELTLDVFRDDDTGSRWDVYRERLAHCGGNIGDWELVSSRTDGSGLARDDVGTADPPAVSRAGTLIAYTHPADQYFDTSNVTSVSLVDLALPITDANRSTLVAGTPISSPETSFVHAGLDQPAMSGDGRFVAFRSDASSTDAVPGWGFGSEPGGAATRQIFVWDRDEIDPFNAVELVSVRVDGQATITGASDPTLSRDGRFVAFTSDDLGLVPAVFPSCPQGCPSQVYRLDRDPDGNGRFDEPTRTAMTLVSSETGTAPVVAGTAPSSQPALSADGQLVAFITKAPNLQLVKASGGGDAADGDLLVADVGANTLRRVTVTDNGVRPAVGSHSRPQLSDTGRFTIFDTLATAQLVPGAGNGRQVVTTTSAPTLSLAEADLGTTLVGFSSDEWYVAVINNGPTAFTPTIAEVSDARFRINAEKSTCILGVAVSPGGDCTVALSFTPSAPGPASARLTVAEEGFQAVSVETTVRGGGGEPALRTDPAGRDMGSVVVGQPSEEFLFDVQNISLVPTSVASIRVTGINAADFAVTSDNCVGRPLNPRSTCSIGLTFVPTAAGRRSALVEIATDSGQYTTMVPDGAGRYEPTFNIDADEVEAGNDFLVGGAGFPPSTPLSILFGDDAANRVDAVTNPDGTFLLWIPTAVNVRGGVRTVVAQTGDGTAASAPIDVIEQQSVTVGLPGFGYGG